MQEVPVEPVAEFAQLPLRFGDHVQWRYELIRPLVLFDDRTATQEPRKRTPIPTPCVPSHAVSTSKGCWGCSPPMLR